MTRVEEIVARHADREGPLLPILHEVQAEYGHVGEDAIRVIAHALNLTRAEVHGVASFYHDFRAKPEARRVIRLCRAEACQARGADALFESFPTDGEVKLEPVYCLGLCAVGPAAVIGKSLHARLDAARLEVLAASA